MGYSFRNHYRKASFISSVLYLLYSSTTSIAYKVLIQSAYSYTWAVFTKRVFTCLYHYFSYKIKGGEHLYSPPLLYLQVRNLEFSTGVTVNFHTNGNLCNLWSIPSHFFSPIFNDKLHTTYYSNILL